MILRHFIETQAYTKKELLDLIELIRIIKEANKQGVTPRLLKDASLGMIFEEPSTRTRISFEVVMTKLARTVCIRKRVFSPGLSTRASSVLQPS